MHVRELKDAGENDERTWGVGAWRESPYFSDAERAALVLAECVTRLADRPDAVPDTVWDDRRGTPHSARVVQQPSPNRLQLLVEALGDASGLTDLE
jgi:alkylhydroperoxidase family enzyme